MERVGCPAPILHATQTASDILSIDIEVIAMKFFLYFVVYIVWTEKIEGFFKYYWHWTFFNLLTFEKPIGFLQQMHLRESSVYLKHWCHILIVKERPQDSWLFK